MSLKLSNNALSRLASSVSASATSISIEAADAGKFPVLAAGDWSPLTIINNVGNFEIVRVTARAGAVLTVARAQEGTTALAFTAGNAVALRLTAGVVMEIQAGILALLPTGAGPLPWSRRAVPPGWLLCDGRVLLAETPYPELRAAYIEDGFPYGQDGSGNPLIPDMRGRVPAGVDNMGGTTAWRITGDRAEIDGTVLGAAGGWEGQTLSADQMPAHTHGVTDPTHTHTVSDPTHAHSTYDPGHIHAAGQMTSAGSCASGSGKDAFTRSATVSGAAATGVSIYAAGTGISIVGRATGVSIQSAGNGWEHSIVQPTIMTNYIVRA